MADSDKNIRITTSKNKTTLPNIVFTGSSAGTSVLTLEVRDDNTVAFTGIDGDVFSLDYNLSTGTIWSVNDKSGTPLLRASAGGTIGIAELGSGVFVGIGQTNPKYKLDVQGWVGFASTGDGSYTILVENGLTTGNNALSIRAANALRFYNSGNTLYTGFIGAQSGVNTTYTLPATTPAATGTSVLSSTQAGVMSWVPLTAGGGSGSVNAGTANFAAYYASSTNAVSENANLQFTGTGLSVGGNVASTSTLTGSLQVRGGLGITGNAFIGGTAYIPSTTPSNISNLLVSNTTATTSTTSGALVVSGGLGLAGNAFIGGTVYVPSSTASNFSNLRVSNTTATTSTTSGALVVSGGLGLAGNAFIGGTVYVPSSTASNFLNLLVSNNTSSTSTSSGTLVVGGGLGLAGNAFIGGTVTQQNNTSSVGTNSGALTVVGGVGIAGNAFIGGTFVHQSTTSSTSTNSGSVTLAGGVGIAGNAFIGGTFVHQSTTSSVGTNSGSVTLAGGIGIAGNAFIGGTFVQQNNTSSVGTNSGAVTIVGGLGLAGNAFIGGTVNATNTTASTSTNSGSLVVTGGAAVGQTLSVGGSLNIFNGANYSGFRFAGSASTTYTLPPRTPTGTGTSFLSSSIDGVMAWVAAPTSGGPSGTINSSNINNIAYYTGSTTLSGDTTQTFLYNASSNGLNIANSDNEAFPSAATGLLRIGTGATNYAAKKALVAVITNSAWTDGDLLVLGVAGAGTTQKFAVDYRGYTQIGVIGTGFTLPITNGSSGQVLTANTNGVASWTTVTGSSSSGGTVYAGTANQIAFYGATGNTVGGSATFTNNLSTGVVNITHTTESTSSTTGALVVSGGAGFAKTVEAGSFKVGTLGYSAPNVLSSFQKSVNSYAQFVIQNTNNGSAASADFVLNNDISTDTTYYANFGINSSNFSGSSSFGLPNAVYLSATTGDLVLGTTASSAIRFVVNSSSSDIITIPSSGTAVSFLQRVDIRSGNDVRLWNSGNTFYTNLKAGNNTANYDLLTPTAPVGAGLSVVLVNTSGQMFFAPVSGLGVSVLGETTPQLRRKRPLTLQFCAGYTPAAAGADTVILKIPDSSLDGVTDVTYLLREFDIRVETPSSGSSRVMLERYNGTTAFAYAATGSSLIGGLGLTISGAGIYFTSTSSFAAGALVTSNDKLRLNWTLLNATHANFSIQLTMEQV